MIELALYSFDGQGSVYQSQTGGFPYLRDRYSPCLVLIIGDLRRRGLPHQTPPYFLSGNKKYGLFILPFHSSPCFLFLVVQPMIFLTCVTFSVWNRTFVLLAGRGSKPGTSAGDCTGRHPRQVLVYPLDNRNPPKCPSDELSLSLFRSS